MGKPDVKVPEPYDLQELLDTQVKMNRFDSTNPWGSQTWHRLPDGRFRMDQQVRPELQAAVDQNIAFANRPAPQYEMMGGMRKNFNALAQAMASRAGVDGFRNVNGNGNHGGSKAETPAAPPPPPAVPQAAPTGPSAPQTPPAMPRYPAPPGFPGGPTMPRDGF